MEQAGQISCFISAFGLSGVAWWNRNRCGNVNSADPVAQVCVPRTWTLQHGRLTRPLQTKWKKSKPLTKVVTKRTDRFLGCSLAKRYPDMSWGQAYQFCNGRVIATGQKPIDPLIQQIVHKFDRWAIAEPPESAHFNSWRKSDSKTHVEAQWCFLGSPTRQEWQEAKRAGKSEGTRITKSSHLDQYDDFESNDCRLDNSWT